MAIGGPTDTQPQIQAGLAAQPLVTSADPNVIGPQAVTQLVDAFRQGAITSQDIMDHVGTVAKAKNKALLQQLGEYVDPATIAARKAEVEAAGSKAQLETQQSHAATQLLPAESQLFQSQLTKEQADVLSKSATDAYLQYNPPIYKEDAEGNPTKEVDMDAIAEAGRPYVRAQFLQQIAAQGLTKVGEPQQVKQPDGSVRTMYRNALGEDISPGTSTFNYYHKLRQQAMQLFITPPKPTKVTAGGGGTSLVSPATTAAAPLPTVEPAAADEEVAPAAATAGVETTPAFTLEGLDKAKLDDPGYKEWANNESGINQFRSMAAQAQEKPNDPYRAEKDRALALQVMNLFQGGAQGGQPRNASQTWKDLVENQPILQRITNAPQMLLGKVALTPATRNDLIEVGESLARSKESTGWNALQRAVTQGQTVGLTPEQILAKPNELALWKRTPATVAIQAGDLRPSPTRPVVGPTSKGTPVTFKTGPYAGKSMISNGDGTFSPAQ